MRPRRWSAVLPLVAAAVVAAACGQQQPTGVSTAPATSATTPGVSTSTAPRPLASAPATPGTSATSSAVAPSPQSPHPTGTTLRPPFPACPSPAPRHAAALAYELTGKQRWRHDLPLPQDAMTNASTPSLVSAGTAYLAVGRTLHALRVSDGTELWSHPYTEDEYGVWAWNGTIVLLTGQVGPHAQVIGLDAATGTVRWTYTVGGTGLYATQAQTGDGGLAMIAETGDLQVLDLGTGRLRWSHHLGLSPGLGAVGSTVVYTVSGSLAGYDSGTGEPKWTIPGVAPHGVVTIAGNLAIVSPNGEGGGLPTADVAVDVSAGRRAWTFDRGHLLSFVGAGPHDVVLAEYVPDRRLYDVDASTGRLRWQATTFAAQDAMSVVTATDVVGVEGGGVDSATVAVVDRALATGAVRWSHPIGAMASRQPVLLTGSAVLVQAEAGRLGQSSPLEAFSATDGRPLWTAGVPAFVGRPDTVAGGGVLVVAEDLMQGCAA